MSVEIKVENGNCPLIVKGDYDSLIIKQDGWGMIFAYKENIPALIEALTKLNNHLPD